MKLKASAAVVALVIGAFSTGAASAQSCTCRSAPQPQGQSARHAPSKTIIVEQGRSPRSEQSKTIIVEEYYAHAPRQSAVSYNRTTAPAFADGAPSSDLDSDASDVLPADYYPMGYGYGYGGGYVGYDGFYGGFYGGYPVYGYRDGFGRPVSGWYRHAGGGARFGDSRFGFDRRVAYTRGPGTAGRGVVVARGPGVPRQFSFAARSGGGGRAMVGGGGARMGGGGRGR